MAIYTGATRMRFRVNSCFGKSGILRPFELFATREGWAELDAAADEAVMHEQWSGKIETTDQAIHANWQPHQESAAKDLTSHQTS